MLIALALAVIAAFGLLLELELLLFLGYLAIAVIFILGAATLIFFFMTCRLRFF